MQYLKRDSKADWRYCDGKQDIYSVGKKWCSKPSWADSVISVANRIEKAIEDYRGRETVDYKRKYEDLKSKVKVLITDLEREIK